MQTLFKDFILHLPSPMGQCGGQLNCVSSCGEAYPLFLLSGEAGG